MNTGATAFLVISGTASAAWLWMMQQSRSRRVRRPWRGGDASSGGDYGPDSDGSGFSWFGHSVDGCSGSHGGSSDAGGDCDGGDGGGGDGGGD